MLLLFCAMNPSRPINTIKMFEEKKFLSKISEETLVEQLKLSEFALKTKRFLYGRHKDCLIILQIIGGHMLVIV